MRDAGGVSIAASLRTILGAVTGLAWRDLEQARANELFEESLVLCREPGNRRILARALINMGYTAVLRGDYERATELCEEAVGMLRGDGNATPLRASLDTLGWAALLRGDYERSRAIHQENLNMSREADARLGGRLRPLRPRLRRGN
jgi:ATP/maltotriose-dependent transcriptional regulator MalT